MIDEEKYEITIGSDLERDGMFLEITEPSKPANCYLEIFYSDVTNTFTISLFKENIDLEIVDEAIRIAKYRLVPIL